MLPGLRFLFAATLMTASLLIFGMGAIALLRASHQQFASLPPLQPPEPVFAQAPASVPSLSMLRADPAPTALPLAALIQPQREASLTRIERVDETPQPVAPAAVPDATTPPAPEASAAAVEPKAEPSPAATADPNVTAATEATAAPSIAVAEAPAQPDKAADPPGETSPPPSEAAAPSPQIAAVAEPASPETTGSIVSDPQAVSAKAVADPPLTQTRPEVAALSQVAAKAAVTTTEAPKKPVAKRKVRHAKRGAPKVERLPATTSAPPLSLSSFFNVGGG